MLHPDAVMYLRIASYYASGQFDLMVSGYWGPMMSWLIAPLLSLVENPLDAARVFMGLSAVVFVLGCISIFRRLEILPAGLVLGTWITALASVAWSVQTTTPDLLLGGLICFAISTMLSPRWTLSRRTQVTAGMLWGAAYLTKAVAFPIAFAVGIVIASLYVLAQLSSIKVVVRSLGISFVGFILFAAPWIIALSLKYQRFVFSTSAKIAHAIIGPKNLDGMHPLVLSPPEPGRISWFEDPPFHLYQQQYWSPFENLGYAKYQLRLIYFNTEAVIKIFSGFDWLHLGFCAAAFGLLVHTPWRKNMQVEQWRWAGGVLFCLFSVYLPVYADSERYYYAAYPFLIAGSIGLVIWLTRNDRRRFNLPRLVGLGLIIFSFANPIRVTLPRALTGLDNPAAVYSRDLATRLQEAGLTGPIAAVGGTGNEWRGDYVGPYIAFFINQPYLGSEAASAAAKFKASGARLLIVDRQLSLVELEQDPVFRDLDMVLFKSKEEADKYPLKTYQVLSP